MDQRIQYNLVQKEIRDKVFKIPAYSTIKNSHIALNYHFDNIMNNNNVSKKEKIINFYKTVIICYGVIYNPKCNDRFKKILVYKLNFLKEGLLNNDIEYAMANKFDLDFITKCDVMYKYTNQMLDNVNKESEKSKKFIVKTKCFEQINPINCEELPAYSENPTEKIGCFSIIKNLFRKN